MGQVDIIYKQLVFAIQDRGFEYQDVRRSSVKRKQVKTAQFEVLLSEGFPLLTLKAMPFKLIVSELLWFLQGRTNIYFLHKSKNHIWDQDAYNYYLKFFDIAHPKFPQNRFTFKEFVDTISQTEDIEMLRNFQNVGEDYYLGDVGKNYSHQWINWENHINQFFNLVCNLRANPMDSRHIVTGWNPSELTETALPPCHWAFEVLVAPTPKWMQEEQGLPEYNFTLKWHQRSVDTFLGLPFNIASYALLGYLIQTITGYHFMSLIGDLSNVHIYSNHYDAIKVLEPLVPTTYGSPEITITTKGQNILSKIVQTLDSTVESDREKEFQFRQFISQLDASDFELHHYQSFEKIQADMVAPDKI